MMRIPQGTTHRVSWPVTSNGQPIANWDNWTVKAQVRPDANSPEILHQWDADSIELVGSDIVLVTLPETSLAWTWRAGVFDIEATDPDGKVGRSPLDYVAVDPAVTRP